VKTMKIVLLLFTLVMTAASAHAAVRSVKGLWVSSSDDRLYWLRLQAPTGTPAALVEELTGTLTTGSVAGSAQTTSETPVTGQYLVRTGIVVLNFGAPGSRRMYAIGDTRGEVRRINLRLFRVRSGQNLDFESELYFDPKNEPKP
jgi:hypothetical protein